MPIFQTIDHVMAIEKELFVPFISGNLGKSLDETTKLQEKLEKFSPQAKVML